MNNINDLNIQSEILPLFDFTHNDFAKGSLLKLLHEPLSSKADIEIRQKIIKGFIGNIGIIKDYSYSRLDFYEVHQFLMDITFQTYVNNIKFELRFSARKRNRASAKFIQFVLLFHHLHNFHIRRINSNTFSGEFKNDLSKLNNFFGSFNLEFYDKLIRGNKFRTKHLIELSKVISEKQATGEINAFYESFFIFEAYLSISQCFCKNQFCFPTFSDIHISFENLYHPLLRDPVKNSLTSNKHVMLLTGPNMSGKSTFLRSVGLCVYLAHVGVGVPATKAELPFFDHLSISINHNDDILSGYSHFMNELMRLKQVLMRATDGKKCFAIFDELFKGTNYEDAVQISSTTIKGLMNFRNSLFLISTHLHQLKNIEQVKLNQVETYYVDCEIKNDNPVFNYKIKAGWSDLKVGQMLFENEGLNELLSPKNPLSPSST